MNKMTDDIWLMAASALPGLLEIFAHIDASVTPAPRPQSVHHGKVAIIPVIGPLFRYPNLFTLLQGTSTYNEITTAFNDACQNPAVKAIVFDIDSPGGEVNGCAALADTIYQARGTKPIIAYASGDCASGAYWLASACDKITVSPTSAIGSIGVVATYRQPDDKRIEIVSSQSPLKRLDPSTDAGKSKLQARIDAIAEVFITAVAKYRNVEAAIVTEYFGQGDVYIGQQALKQQLVDELGTLNDLLHMKENKMDYATLQAEHPALLSEISIEEIAKGRLEERKRIAAIMTASVAEGLESLAQHLAFATELPVENVIAALQAMPVVTTPASTGFNEFMATMNNPKILPSEESASDIEHIAKRIATLSKGEIA